MIGMKDNRGFEKVIEIGDNDSEESEAIYNFLKQYKRYSPVLWVGTTHLILIGSGYLNVQKYYKWIPRSSKR